MNQPRQHLTKDTLIDELDLNFEQLDSYIRACQLNVEQHDYLPDDVELIKNYHCLIGLKTDDKEQLEQIYQKSLKENKSVKEALEQVKKKIEENAFSDALKPLKPPQEIIELIDETVTLFELLNIAQDLTSKPMTLSKAIEFLKACNLPEQPQYEPGDANRFLDAVERVINRGESIREVAVRNGVTNNNPFDWLSGASTNQVNQINSGLGARVEILDSKIKGSYEQMYLKKLEESFFNGDFQRTYDQAYNQSRREREQREKSPFDQFIEQLDEGMANLGLSGGSAYTIEATPTYEALPSSDNESSEDNDGQ